MNFSASVKLHYLQFGFQKYLMNTLFIAYENNEWCLFVVRIDSPAFISFYCVCFLSVSFFFLFLSYFFVYFTTCLCIEVIFSILKTKQWSCSQISKWSFKRLLQPYLVINVTGLIQFGQKLKYILPPLASRITCCRVSP